MTDSDGQRREEGVGLPLRPGDEHAILFDADAERFARSVNYVAGDDILLHLILRAPEDVLVANDLLDGGWGAERRLPLAGARGAEGVRVRVVVAEDGFLIGLGEEEAVAFRPRCGMAGQVDLRGAPGVTIAVRSGAARGGLGQPDASPPAEAAPVAGHGSEPQAPAVPDAGERRASPPAAVADAAAITTAAVAGNRIGELERRAEAQEARMAALEAAIGRRKGDAAAMPADAELACIPAALLDGIGLHAPVFDGRHASRWLGRHAALVLRERVPAREISLGVAAIAPGLDREALFCTVNGIRADHRWLDDGRGRLALCVAIPEGGDLGGMVGVLRLSFDGVAEAPDGTAAVTIACTDVTLSRSGRGTAGGGEAPPG
jgi:hypothetical protein